jgi:DNA-binding LacI/PurR family transcriptional regulator
MRITIKDVARRAGVGVGTVSRVINRSGPVKPETKARVEATIRELNYMPNEIARSMVRGTTRTVAVVIPDMGMSVLMGMVQGLNEVAYERGYTVMALDSKGEAERERRMVRVAREKRVDGLVLFGTPGTTGVLRQIRKWGLPVVVLDRLLTSSLEDVQVPQVAIDHIGGARLAMNLLLQYSRRPVHVAGPMNASSALYRLQVFGDMLAEHDIPFDQRFIEQGEFTYEGGYRATLALLERVPDLDGVFAANDFMALGVLRALAESGRRVPDDVRVVGFDDIFMAALSNPPLTTIHHPTTEIGRLAMNILLDVMERGQASSDVTLVPARLVRRQSC